MMENNTQVVYKYDVARMQNSEDRSDLLLKLLNLLSNTGDQIDLIHEILMAIQLYTNFEAVGIRLKKDFDYPYYEAIGFPASFIADEQYLCKRDDNGKLFRDLSGNPIHECMCGNIISARFDPSLNVFTGNGSFWTNCTSELLPSAMEEVLQQETRNRCNGEGYESVALIPLKTGDGIIGLLQLNDKRKDMLSESDVNFLEEISIGIGTLISKKQSEKNLSKSRLQLELALEEKEVMEKEIHHRVKNNLQIIISLLNLQKRNIKDEENREILRDSLNRIQAIAYVHERLYDSDNLARIDFDVYIKALVRELMYTYKYNSKKIGIDIEAGGIQLKVEQAIPLGIIVTELFTNAIKYAIPHCLESREAITIHLNKLPERKVELIVSDNGPGIQGDFDISHAESTGLLLVASLVRQLNGTITVNNINGTTFVVRFKIK